MTTPDPPVTFDPTRLSDAVLDVMAAVVAAAASVDVTLPARQITGVGPIPYDCEMVFATATNITTGAPESGSSRSGSGTYPNAESNNTLYKVAINVGIVRKTTEIPTGAHGQGAPAPATFLANLTSASNDVSILITACDKIQRDEGVAAVPRTLTTAAPQGGMFAVVASISLLV